MSKHHGRRITRHTAEQLLHGGVPGDAPDAVAGLLAAAAAPPRDGELGGEHAAMTAFRRAAQHNPISPPRNPSMIKTTLAKLLTVKAAAIFAVGGVATAAATGTLPLPATDAPSPTARPASDQPTAGSSIASTSTHPTGASSAGHEPSSSPSPSLVGLCHAYTAGNKAEHGKALDSPAFTALIQAAGDKTKVDGYCATVLTDQTSTVRTTDPAAPTSAPGQSGDDHGAAANHPTGAPDTHPSGPPTTHPTH